MAAGRGRDADRRGRVPLVLAAAVRVHVGVALTTAIAFAPAEPSGTSSASSTSARYSATVGGRVRDTSRRTLPAVRGRGRRRLRGREHVGPARAARPRRRVGHAVERERDVHGPVGAAFAPLARAVERVDDPHPLAGEALG